MEASSAARRKGAPMLRMPTIPMKVARTIGVAKLMGVLVGAHVTRAVEKMINSMTTIQTATTAKELSSCWAIKTT